MARFKYFIKIAHYESTQMTCFQKDNCDAARHALNEKLVEFGDDYFYTFGLNQKFCLGIRKFTSDSSRTQRKGEYSLP